MTTLSDQVLACALRLRSEIDDAGECPETGSTLIDGEAILRVAHDLEFAARNDVEREALWGELVERSWHEEADERELELRRALGLEK